MAFAGGGYSAMTWKIHKIRSGLGGLENADKFMQLANPCLSFDRHLLVNSFPDSKTSESICLEKNFNTVVKQLTAVKFA